MNPSPLLSSPIPNVEYILKEPLRTYLVQVDNWLPEVVALLVEVSHTDLSEVTWMVLIHIGSVVMLSTSKTTTTGMLAVLSYTTVTGGNVSATVIQGSSASVPLNLPVHCSSKVSAS